MKPVAKYLRLLPAVVIVGTGLLALKGIDLARAAQTPSQGYDEPDNSGLAPADGGGAPATHDFAADETVSGSAGEVDVLSSLTRRRAELDARERALNMRENLLSAGEGRVDQKIDALKNLQTQIQGLLVQRDAKQDAQIASLIKSYGPDGMKPAQAAAIFNTMPDEVLLPIAKGMKAGDLGSIMAKMNPDAAQKLTVKLAALLKLPENAPAAICPTPPQQSADLTTPLPGTTASAAPPQQLAALSPPGSTPVVSPLPTPPAPPPTPAATPAPAPAQAVPPPAQAAATPPKPHAPPVHHPAKPAATPPAKPATAAATPPAKPVVTITPPLTKPTAAAATPAPATPTPPPATTPPVKPTTQAASGPPAAITPPPGG